MRKVILGLILLVFILSCQEGTKIDSNRSNRPIDTWVFRSVLDQNPRMITAALHKNLYVSYYTQKGLLYKAWKGIVNFEGAVYDGAHGPQPTSVGDAYLINENGNIPWQLLKDGQLVESDYNYLGHRLTNGSVEFMFELSDKSGKNSVKIFESIDYKNSDSGALLLDRQFLIESNSDYTVSWTGNAIVADKSQITSNNDIKIGEAKTIKIEGKSFEDYAIQLNLKNGEPVGFNYPINKPLFEDPNIEDGFDMNESDLPEGALLISKNDCKTCHNKNKTTVGPAYVTIAKKYAHNDENILLLSNKIKKGGSGIYGEQVMTPHPEISNYDLKAMVSYIFTLAEFEGKEEEKSDQKLELINAADIKEENLVPGSITQVYNVKPGTVKIPTDLSNQKAIMAGVLANFDNISGGDFGGLEDNFAILSTGYLQIPEDGDYEFRLWSDDGSKLYLHDKLLIDHDGPHGTSMRQTTVKLAKGYHPFKLEFYQGEGGKFLSFNYKPPNAEAWAVVPLELLSHHKDDRSVIGDLSLPMSAVTKIPGDGQALNAVHPSFDLTQARPDDFKPKVGGLDFMPDGRMLVSNWDTEGGIYIVDGDKSVKKIADGLAEPLGLKVVDGRIFVMQKQEMTELVDTNGDDIIDEYRTLCDDWGVSNNFHEFGFGLEHDDGYLYANLATGIMPGGAGMVGQHPDRGSSIRVLIADGSYEIVANGLRTPNGVGKGYNDEIFIADNQGDWLPASKIVHVEKGDWFGSRAVDFEGTANLKEKKPVVWLPQDEIGNSPSTPSYLNIGPYKNQMIHGEVTHGGVKRVFVEEVNGLLQGCLFRFTQGLEAGVNRIAWGPDGHLYAGGIGNPGNWQHSGNLWYGLQRLAYNGNSTFEMLAVRAQSNGVEIEFTEPLKEGDGWLKENYEVKQWYYKPTADYGGPKLDEKQLNVLSVNVSEDRRKVFLELNDMKSDHVVYIRLKENFISDNDNSLWSTEAWYTMNNIPVSKPGFKTTPPAALGANSLSTKQKADGWELLFDGRTLNEFHTFKREDVDKKWIVEDGAIFFNPTIDGKGGDLVTNSTYENFELNLEWKISNCGNSGIFYNVVEDEKYCCTWLTGPEMQILDNTCHPDTKYETHRAGDLYDMIQCSNVTVKPAGEWNKVRLISNNGDLAFWLNGYKVVSFKMHDESWDDMKMKSKFKDMEDFGKFTKGHIALQDHGDKVWFRNLKIKKL